MILFRRHYRIAPILVLLAQGTLGFIFRDDAALHCFRGGADSCSEDGGNKGGIIGRGPLEPVRPFVPDLLRGKHALVTGGNRGIGEAITVALVEAGAKVCVMANNEEAFHKMVSRHDCLDASKDGGNVSWVKVDLGKPSDAVESARQAVAWAGGTMDILVNNAGICVLEDFMDITSSSFDEIIAINTRAPLLVSQVCLEGMIEQNYGKIVNISSISAVRTSTAHAAYAASKSALDGITRGLVVDLSKHNIQVNNIAPTVAWSDMGLTVWSDPAKSQPRLDATPLGRFVECWEVANVVVFLCSDACTMCLGQTICVDGGFTCQ